MDQEGKDLGHLVDRALGDLGVGLPSSFDPRAQAAPSRGGSRWYALRAATAAGVLLVAGAASQGLWNGSVVAPTPTSQHNLLLPTVRSARAQETIPLWRTAGSGGHPWQEVVNTHPLGSLSGSEVVSAGPTGERALSVGYRDGRPLWVQTGARSQHWLAADAAGRLTGQWHLGDPGALTSLAAAGNYVYVTSGGRWAVMNAPVSSLWRSEPDPLATSSWIQALPGNPATAVLYTIDAGSEQGMFWRNSLTGPWRPEPVPGTPITELVAAGSRFWALAGGRLVVSSNGHRWTVLYTPPPGFAVTTFAVDPVGSGEVTLALESDDKLGVGPILLSRNDGATWHTLPPAWPTSSGAASLVLDPRGDVSALFGGNGGPVVIQRWNAVTKKWAVLPLPQQADVAAAGQFAALNQGDLVYADARGTVFVWTLPRGVWHALPNDPGHAPGPVSLLMGIGPRQVLAAYRNQWSIFVSGNSGG
jgi:hypothetical protein